MVTYLSILAYFLTVFFLLLAGHVIYDTWYHIKYGYPYFVVYAKRQDGQLYYCSRHYISKKKIDTFKDLDIMDKRLQMLDGASEVIIFNVIPLSGYSKYED